jgi:hypothetical protein
MNGGSRTNLKVDVGGSEGQVGETLRAKHGRAYAPANVVSFLFRPQPRRELYSGKGCAIRGPKDGLKEMARCAQNECISIDIYNLHAYI